MYAHWRRILPAWVQLVPVELPGRGIRFPEELIEDCETLTTILYEELAPKLVGDYAFFGHSMGGLLAYQLVKQIQAANKTVPRMLCVSACIAPSVQEKERYAHRENRAALIGDLRERGGTPAEIFEHREMLDITVNLMKADYGICESFRYRDSSALTCPIHVFGGDRDDINTAELEAWEKERASGFSLSWFNGGHFFLREHEDAFLSTLIEILGKCDATPGYA